MRRALKRVLLPALKNLGFTARTTGHARTGVGHLDLLSLWYWKYGGEFILEFARCERGPMQTSWGPLIPEEELGVAHINPRDRARLEQVGPSAGPSLRGFVYAGFGEETQSYLALAEEVTALLPQVDLWLQAKKAGSHVHPFTAGD